MIWDVWIQAGMYAFMVALVMLLMSAIMHGFMWKYLKVRASFGRLILIQVRTPFNRYFSIGRVQDDFLIYKKENKQEVRLSITNEGIPYYRCMGIAWITIDEGTGVIDSPDFQAVTGFDQEKFSNLYERALMRPSIGNTWEKTLFVICIIILIAIVADIYLSYCGYNTARILQIKLAEWFAGAKGSIIQGGSTI